MKKLKVILSFILITLFAGISGYETFFYFTKGEKNDIKTSVLFQFEEDSDTSEESSNKEETLKFDENLYFYSDLIRFNFKKSAYKYYFTTSFSSSDYSASIDSPPEFI